jgi:predicted RNase H-like HicB family nuclease
MQLGTQQTKPMEQIAKLHIEKLPEGVYLATSDDIPGLVAQGRTVAETIEIARDVAKKLLEAQLEHSPRQPMMSLTNIEDNFDYPLVLGI